MRHDRPTHDDRNGLLFAAAAAVIYGAAYPATAIALRSFTPLGIAALACSLALPVVIALGWIGWLPRPSIAGMDGPRLVRLIVLSALGGLAFIAAINVAIALSGSTVTGFVAPLYAVAAALLAVPLLGERMRPATLGAFGLALCPERRSAPDAAGHEPRRPDRVRVPVPRLPDAHPGANDRTARGAATMPFVYAHLGKPELELLSTLGGGRVYGWLTWRTGSIVWGALGHVVILTLVTVAAS